jgi:hypothetical protein
MPYVGFEPTIKASDHAATGTSFIKIPPGYFIRYYTHVYGNTILFFINVVQLHFSV